MEQLLYSQPWMLPFVFAGLWILVEGIFSLLGWTWWAQRFACPFPSTAKLFRCRYATFLPLFGRYRNITLIAFSPEGVHVKASLLFRTFHPPFLIPWRAITKMGSIKWLFFTGYEFEAEDGNLHLKASLSDEAYSAASAFHKSQNSNDPRDPTP